MRAVKAAAPEVGTFAALFPKLSTALSNTGAKLTTIGSTIGTTFKAFGSSIGNTIKGIGSLFGGMGAGWLVVIGMIIAAIALVIANWDSVKAVLAAVLLMLLCDLNRKAGASETERRTGRIGKVVVYIRRIDNPGKVCIIKIHR